MTLGTFSPETLKPRGLLASCAKLSIAASYAGQAAPCFHLRIKQRSLSEGLSGERELLSRPAVFAASWHCASISPEAGGC